jgi:hypothetical protein
MNKNVIFISLLGGLFGSAVADTLQTSMGEVHKHTELQPRWNCYSAVDAKRVKSGLLATCCH